MHRSSFSIMSTKRNLNRPRHCRSGVSDSDAHSLEGADISAQSDTDIDKDTDGLTHTSHSGLAVKTLDLLYL